MVRSISIRENKDELIDLLGSVSATGEPMVVEDAGTTPVVIVTHEDYQRIVREQDQELRSVIDGIRERNAHRDPDEVIQEVTEIVEEVRQELYAKQQRTDQSSC